MSVRLFLLERYLPGPIRRRTFRDLVGLTAEAFGVDMPAIDRLPQDEAVAAFARFSRAEVDRALAAGGTSEAIRGELHRRAREMGETVRRRLGIDTREDVIRALRLLYAAIGIEFEEDVQSGDVTIRRCAFSDLYTPVTCAFMSAVDGGLADGLSGGATLVFAERITEGAPCCRARLTWSPRS